MYRLTKMCFKHAIFFCLLCFALQLHAEDIVKKGSFAGAKTATHPDWFKESFLDLEEDISDAAAHNKRLVVYFWQEGCPYCSQLWEDNFSQKDIENNFRKNFEIVAINLWGDRDVTVKGKNFTEKSFAEALNIKYTPTLLFFNEKQKVTLQLNGYIPPEDFRLALEYAALRDESKPAYAAYVTKNRENKTTKNTANSGLHHEDFFSRPEYNLKRLTQKPESKKTGKYIAVFFEKTDCKNCDLLHQKTLKNPLTRKLVKQFEAIQLDRFSNTPVITPQGTKTTAKKWADQLNIIYQPAIVFFDPKGNEVMRIDAQLRSFHIQSVFDYVLSGAYKTQKNFQRYISTRADILREHGVNVDIWAY